MLEHTWPGNIRELENVMHHAVLVSHGDLVTAEDLRLSRPTSRSKPPPPAVAKGARLDAALTELFEDKTQNVYQHVEQALFRAAYRYCENNQVQTAKLLGISRNVVRARLLQYGAISGPTRAESVARPPGLRRFGLVTPKAFGGRTVIKIGYQALGLLTLLKARGTLDKSFAQSGIDVEWKQYPGGLQIVEALQAGQVDLSVVGEGPPAFALARGVPLAYLAAEPASPAREAIVVLRESPIRHIRDLRGRTVVLNQGSNVHYLLLRALEEAGVPYDDVHVRYAEPAVGWAAFENGEADAWGIWDPLLASVTQQGDVRVLRDGQGLAANTLYYVARRPFADEHAHLVERFLGELHLTAEWARANAIGIVDLLAAELELSRDAVVRSVGVTRVARPHDRGVRGFAAADRRRVPSAQTDTPSRENVGSGVVAPASAKRRLYIRASYSSRRSRLALRALRKHVVGDYFSKWAS